MAGLPDLTQRKKEAVNLNTGRQKLEWESESHKNRGQDQRNIEEIMAESFPKIMKGIRP